MTRRKPTARPRRRPPEPTPVVPDAFIAFEGKLVPFFVRAYQDIASAWGDRLEDLCALDREHAKSFATFLRRAIPGEFREPPTIITRYTLVRAFAPDIRWRTHVDVEWPGTAA